MVRPQVVLAACATNSPSSRETQMLAGDSAESWPWPLWH
eukprot:CAMPEP_0114540288 /NCGR_PEP_ID=MMETSP0114-20121206/682_1 /TAXON_ID=31324 /ORGANISM="Goniomonas sp, Strain m" /LENGTH=38 /DNA_ID= /DNA_START= /DNA_END= /DNA_ORIENTATION=